MNERELMTLWNGLQLAIADAESRIARNLWLVKFAMHMCGVGLCLAGINLFPRWSSGALMLTANFMSIFGMLISFTAYVRMYRQRVRHGRLLIELQHTADKLRGGTPT